MKKIGYIIFILLLAFAISEIGLRQTKKYLTYSEQNTGKFETDYGKSTDNYYHLWSFSSEFEMKKDEYSYTYYTNMLGFREMDLPPADTLNQSVFVFGDSFIEGAGAPYESTFPRYLEEVLIREYKNYRVYNFGVSGADPFYNYMVLKRIAAVRPAYVIFSINFSDVQDYITRGGFERFDAENEMVHYRKGPWFHSLYIKSHVMRFMVHTVFGMDNNFIRQSKKGEIEKEALNMIEECLVEAARICNQYGIRFMVLSHPFPNEICDGDNDYIGDQDVFVREIDQVPIVHISQRMASMMRERDCKSYAWPIDGHFNAKGYELMANAFYLTVKEYNDAYFDINQSH